MKSPIKLHLATSFSVIPSAPSRHNRECRAATTERPTSSAASLSLGERPNHRPTAAIFVARTLCIGEAAPILTRPSEHDSSRRNCGARAAASVIANYHRGGAILQCATHGDRTRHCPLCRPLAARGLSCSRRERIATVNAPQERCIAWRYVSNRALDSRGRGPWRNRERDFFECSVSVASSHRGISG